jgi:hypothetical protein
MKHRLRFMGLVLGVVATAAVGCGGGTSNSTATSSGSGGDGGSGATGGGTGGTAGSGGTGTGGTGTGGTATGGSTGTAGGGGTGTGGGAACDGFQGQATASEIAASPYPDQEAEVLALEASGKLVAPKDVYQRIVTDLALIRGQNAQVQNIGAMASWVPGELLMGFDAAGLAAVSNGTYTDWDCPNALYGMSGAEPGSSYVLLHFDHRFNVPLLAKDYKALPHAQYAEPNGFGGDGNDVCVSIEGSATYHYVFDAGSGDCPAGCIEHTYWGFTTEGSPVKVTSLGTFSNAQGVVPAWYSGLAACTQWL